MYIKKRSEWSLLHKTLVFSLENKLPCNFLILYILNRKKHIKNSIISIEHVKWRKNMQSIWKPWRSSHIRRRRLKSSWNKHKKELRCGIPYKLSGIVAMLKQGLPSSGGHWGKIAILPSLPPVSAELAGPEGISFPAPF